MKKQILYIMALLLGFAINAQNVTVGGSTGSTDKPTGTWYNYHHSQFIYLGSEINKSGNITKLAFTLTSTISSANFDKIKEWEIRLGTTSNTEYTGSASSHSFLSSTALFDGNATLLADNKTIEVTLNNTFAYNSSDNLVIDIIEKSSGYKSVNFVAFNTDSWSDDKRCVYKTSDSSVPTSPSSIQSSVPQVIIGFQPEYSATPVDAEKSEVSINKAAVTGNGTDKASITVQLKDASGINLTKSGGVLTFNSSDVINITDNADGTYTAEFASSTVGNQTITATVTKPSESGVVLGDTVAITVLPNTNINVGSGTCGNGTTKDVPFYYGDSYDDDYKSWSKLLYLNSELTAATITEIGFYTCTTSTINNATKQKIYMKEVINATISNNTAPTATELANDYTLVYDGDIQWQSGANQLNRITLSTPFTFSGTKNLLLYFSNEHGTNLVNSFSGGPLFVRDNTSSNRSVYQKYKTTKGTGTIGTTFPKTYFKFAVSGIANTFNQTVNTDWNNTSNWSLGAVPTATDNTTIVKDVVVNAVTEVKNITVNSGVALVVNEAGALTVKENITNNGNVTINSNATTSGSLIVEGTASTGNVTYKRYLMANASLTEGWHLTAAPVSGQNINDVKASFVTNENKYAIATYKNNTTANRWSYYTTGNIATAGNFVDAKGYSLKVKTNGTLNFTGTLVNDTSISITDGGDEPAGNRWNLIGNPYASAINGGNMANASNNFLKTNIAKLDPTRAGLYLWNGTAYVEKSIDDAAFYIAPGQAFFVHAPDNGGTSIDFTKAMQTHQTAAAFYRNSGTTYPEIKITANNKQAKVRYIEGKTKGLDVGSDIGTFTAENNNFSIFTNLLENGQGEKFAIQALPNANYNEMTIPLGFTINEASKEVALAINLSNIPSGLNVYIEDTKTTNYTLVKDGDSYNTTLNADENGIGRFYIHTTAQALSTESVIASKVSVYAKNKQLNISGIEGATTIKVFNVLGKLIHTTSYVASGEKNISMPAIAQGMYVVSIKNKDKETSRKVIFN